MPETECCASCRASLVPGSASCPACGSVVWLSGPTRLSPPDRATKQRSITRRRLAAGLTAAVGAVAAVRVFGVASDDPSPSRLADRMVPVVSVDHGTTTLHATLPNGTQLVLTYPADVKLAELGATAYGTFDGPDPLSIGPGRCCSYYVTFSYANIDDLYLGAPVTTYRGAHGTNVDLFHASQRRTPPDSRSVDRLVFSFGHWVAEIPVRVGAETEQERIDLAAHVQADIQHDGFPALRLDGDLHRGSDMGTGIIFGDLTTTAPQVHISSGFCSDPGSNTSVRRPGDKRGAESGLIWCDESTKLLIEVTGPTDFTTVLGDQLKLRNGVTK